MMNIREHLLTILIAALALTGIAHVTGEPPSETETIAVAVMAIALATTYTILRRWSESRIVQTIIQSIVTFALLAGYVVYDQTLDEFTEELTRNPAEILIPVVLAAVFSMVVVGSAVVLVRFATGQGDSDTEADLIRVIAGLVTTGLLAVPFVASGSADITVLLVLPVVAFEAVRRHVEEPMTAVGALMVIGFVVGVTVSSMSNPASVAGEALLLSGMAVVPSIAYYHAHRALEHVLPDGDT